LLNALFRRRIWPVKLRNALLSPLFFLAASVFGQSPDAATPRQHAAVAPQQEATAVLQNRVEAYLRQFYAWGSDIKLTFSTFREGPVPGLYELTVELSKGEQKDSAVLYVTHDGKYLVRGEISDLTKDPFAETRAQLHLEDSPSLGPADAPVTVVEFADFECPACGHLHGDLKALLENYPRVQFVYKDFPLSQIHPWARTAALAGRCVYSQNKKAFWAFYDMLYEKQDLISAENAWDEMMEYSGAVGTNPEEMKNCMNSVEAGQAIDASHAQGQQLEITSTPTLFINGRRLVGPDINLVKQSIEYDLAHPAKPEKGPTR
jgi:protein-disulfide isomerase